MNPYDRAAFGFAKAYQMNTRAADEQRRANQPSTSAFAEVVDQEEDDYSYSPQPQVPTHPNERHMHTGTGDGTILDQSNGHSLARARQKVSKYLRSRS